jgi:hypothetical protein
MLFQIRLHCVVTNFDPPNDRLPGGAFLALAGYHEAVNTTGIRIPWLVVGTLIGALIGFLFAPAQALAVSAWEMQAWRDLRYT